MLPKHRRGPWLTVEDNTLLELVHSQGATNWVRISQMIGTRSPKQCRERFHQNLKPSLNLDPISPEEGVLIERYVAEMGKRWAEIARRLHNRSDNAVKNWWNGGMNRRKRLENRRADYQPRQSTAQQQQPQQVQQQPQQPQAQQMQQQQSQQFDVKQHMPQQHQHQQQQMPQQHQQQMAQQQQHQMPQQMMQQPQHQPQQAQMQAFPQIQHPEVQQQANGPQPHVSSYDFYPRQQVQATHLAPTGMPYGHPQYMNHARRLMEQQPLASPSGFSGYPRGESADGAPPSLMSDMSYNTYSHPSTPRQSGDMAQSMGVSAYHQRQLSGHTSSYGVGTSYPAPTRMDAQPQAYPLLAEQWPRQSSSPDPRGNQLPFGGQLPMPPYNGMGGPGGSPDQVSKDARMKLGNLMN